MSRTKAKVLMEIVDSVTYHSIQVVESTGVWSVYYDGQPINLKSSNHLDETTPTKYKKTSFGNSGPARNLCKRLNESFKTDKFSVVFLQHGTLVYPADEQD
jgi:hypothetical protein